MVGEDSFDELIQMSVNIRRMGLPEKERDTLLNAIDTLVELIEEDLKEDKLCLKKNLKSPMEKHGYFGPYIY